VSVQYGANQPEYDIVVVKREKWLKVSVKGSQGGGWGLTQSFLKNRDYRGAIRLWLRRHNPSTIFAFVQFKDVRIGGMPRVYLATPKEVAKRLRETAKGRGDTILFEKKRWSQRAAGAGTIEEIPPRWRFGPKRIAELLRDV
jgi:hypothetical protein